MDKTFISKIKSSIYFADMISRQKDGTIIIRRGYYYGMFDSGENFAISCEKRLIGDGIPAKLINFGNHYESFKGGKNVKHNSHYWCLLKEIGE